MVSEKSVKKDWEKIWSKKTFKGNEDLKDLELNPIKRIFNNLSNYLKKLENTWNFNKFRNEYISDDLRSLTEKKNIKVLDEGCGDGQISFDYLPVHAEKILTDVSGSALRLANDRLKKEPKNLNSKIVMASAVDLPFKSLTFDLITNFGVIQYFNKVDQKKILSEIERVLRKNGRVFIAVPSSKAYIFKFGMNFAKKSGQWKMGDEKTFESIKDLVEDFQNLEVEKEYSGGALIQLYHLIYFFNINKILRLTLKKIYLVLTIYINRIFWFLNFKDFFGIYLFGIIRKL